jgi:hypothetical protein
MAKQSHLPFHGDCFVALLLATTQGAIMCRSIKPLRMPDRPATEQEIQEAALQYVRKVSGYRKPSRANEEAFQKACDEVAEATRKMLNLLPAKQPPASS